MTQAASLLALQDLDIEIMRAKKRLDELPEKREILGVRHKMREVTELHGKADLLVKKLSADDTEQGLPLRIGHGVKAECITELRRTETRSSRPSIMPDNGPKINRSPPALP